jgi:hypothetical protein
MATNSPQSWSTTPALNTGVDSDIGTVADSSAPNTVDNWARAIQSGTKKFILDISGNLVAGGSATALTVTTNQVIESSYITNGFRLCVRTASAATGAATIAVDGHAAVTILKNDTTAIVSGDWAQDAILDLVYSSADTAFIATNISPQSSSAGSFTTIELGGATDTTLARASAGVVTVEGNRLCRIYTGTYTGDGSTSKSVTGVGFTPKYVKIWPRITTDNTDMVWFETTDTIIDDIATGAAVSEVAGTNETKIYDNQIIAFGADGFTVDDAGADEDPNTNGQVYNFLCLG